MQASGNLVALGIGPSERKKATISMRLTRTRNQKKCGVIFPQSQLLILIFNAALCCLAITNARGQTIQFASQSFVLADKESDEEKIENDYLPSGQKETDWSEKLMLIRFPAAKDVKAFAENLCLAINGQRPEAGAKVSQFGSDCYVVYSVTSSNSKRQLTMAHRVLIDPQGGVRTYVFAQRPSVSKAAVDQAPIDHDECIRALSRLSPIMQLLHN
jgi:hypothetical protein